MSAAPVFDIGTASRFLQKLANNLLYGITWRDERGFPVSAHVMASVICIIPFFIAFPISFFGGSTAAFIVGMVLSAATAILFFMLSHVSVSAKYDQKGRLAGGLGSYVALIVFPMPKPLIIRIAIQVIALCIPVCFFVLNYYRVSMVHVSIFIAMLWSPALRSIDSCMNVFKPDAIVECTLTNAFFVIGLAVPSIVLKVIDEKGGAATYEVYWFVLTNVCIPVLPFFLFFGIIPQVVPFFLGIGDYVCANIGLKIYTPWSFIIACFVIPIVVLGRFFAFLSIAILCLGFTTFRYTSVFLMVLTRFLFACVGLGVALAIYFTNFFFYIDRITTSPFFAPGGPFDRFSIGFNERVLPYAVLVTGAALYFAFQLSSALVLRATQECKGFCALHIVATIFALFCLIFPLLDILTTMYFVVIDRKAGPSDTNFANGVYVAVMMSAAVGQAFTEPTAMFTSMFVGGIALQIAYAVTDGLRSLAGVSIVPYYFVGKYAPKLLFSFYYGAIIEAFLHRFIIGAKVYGNLIRNSLQKPLQGWARLLLGFSPVLVPWSVAVLLVCTFFSIPTLSIGGTPVLLPFYPRMTKFLWSSVRHTLSFCDFTIRASVSICSKGNKPTKMHQKEPKDSVAFHDAYESSASQKGCGWQDSCLTSDFSGGKGSGDVSNFTEQVDDLLMYDSIISFLFGYPCGAEKTAYSGRKASRESPLLERYLAGAFGSQGFLLPGLFNLGFGTPRIGDCLLLLSGKRLILLRFLGQSVLTGYPNYDITVLETKETSCHTLERTSLETMATKGLVSRSAKTPKQIPHPRLTDLQPTTNNCATTALNTALNGTAHLQQEPGHRLKTEKVYPKFLQLTSYRGDLHISDYDYQDFSLQGMFTSDDARVDLRRMFFLAFSLILVNSLRRAREAPYRLETDLQGRSLPPKMVDDLYTKLGVQPALQNNRAFIKSLEPLMLLLQPDISGHDSLIAAVAFSLLRPLGWDIAETDIYPLFSGSAFRSSSFVYTKQAASAVQQKTKTLASDQALPLLTKKSAPGLTPPAGLLRGVKPTKLGALKLSTGRPAELTPLQYLPPSGVAHLDIHNQTIASRGSPAQLSNTQQHLDTASDDVLDELDIADDLGGTLPNTSLCDTAPLTADEAMEELARPQPSLAHNSSMFAPSPPEGCIPWGNTASATVLSNVFGEDASNMSSLLSNDEKEYLVIVGQKAFQRSIEIAVQALSMGDSLPSTVAEMHTLIVNQCATVLISTIGTAEWVAAIQEKQYTRLFTVKEGPRVYAYSLGSVAWSVFCYPGYACEMTWNVVQTDLLVFGSSDEERFSVQSLPSVLRNVMSEAAVGPFGYPLKSYGVGSLCH